MRVSSVQALLLLAPSTLAQLSRGWNYTWPTSTQQCQNVSMNIFGGTSPWSVLLVPIGGVPVIWTVRSREGRTPNRTDPVTASVPMQFPAGTHYSVVVADSNGYAGGSADVLNPTPLQRVRESTNAQCLSAIRPVSHEFTFDAFGSASPCGTDFSLSWSDKVGRGPYEMTVIPLDTSYSPWDVPLPSRSEQPGVGWRVNMTAGTRFTVVMSNDNGWGRGGVGRVYEVVPGTTTSCITQTYLGRVTWRAEIEPIALPAAPSFTTTILAQTAPTPSATANDVTSIIQISTSVSDGDAPSRTGDPSQSAGPGTGSDSSGAGTRQTGGGNTGAIAGGVAGGVIAVILAALLIWWLRRRKRAQAEAADNNANSDRLDMSSTPSGPSGGGGSFEPKVVPYQPVPTSPSPSPGSPYGIYHGPSVQYGNTITAYQNSDSPYSAYDDTRPMSWSGPAAAMARSTDDNGQKSDGRRFSGVYGEPVGDSASHYPSPLASPQGFAPVPAISERMSQSSLSTNPPIPPRSSQLDSPPLPMPPVKTVSPPTFTSDRTERALSTISSAPNPHRQSSLPPGAGPAAGSQSGAENTHPHQEFHFVKHTDAEASERVELPPDYRDIPGR